MNRITKNEINTAKKMKKKTGTVRTNMMINKKILFNAKFKLIEFFI